MRAGGRRRFWNRAAWATGIVVGVVTLALLADGLREPYRAGAEQDAIEALEARIGTEAEVSGQLDELQQAQTERSKARERRNQWLAWTLLVAAVGFVGSVKMRQSLGSGGPLQLVTLGAESGGQQSRPGARRSVAMLPPAEASGPDLGFVDQAIERVGSGREATIPILQALQTHYRYLPEAALRRLCEKTEITPAQIIGVASFYAQFRRQPVGRHLVRVCHGTACHVAGVGPIMDELRRRLAIPTDGDTDPARRFTLESVNCLGCCSLAPVMMVENHVAGHLTPTGAWQELEAVEVES